MNLSFLKKVVLRVVGTSHAQTDMTAATMLNIAVYLHLYRPLFIMK